MFADSSPPCFPTPAQGLPTLPPLFPDFCLHVSDSWFLTLPTLDCMCRRDLAGSREIGTFAEEPLSPSVAALGLHSSSLAFGVE